jgi:hypothetical protein
VIDEAMDAGLPADHAVTVAAKMLRLELLKTKASVRVADNLGFELMGEETTASDNEGEYRQAVYKRTSPRRP